MTTSRKLEKTNDNTEILHKDNPIDRTNRDDLLKQIGRVEIGIRELNKKQNKVFKKLKSLPKQIKYYEIMKQKYEDALSKKQLYLNQLENDINTLDNNKL